MVLSVNLLKMPSVEVSLSFVSRNKIHALNKKHRGIDAPTDVLSFPLWTTGELKRLLHSQVITDSGILLGDIIICREIAKKKGFSVKFLMLHGTLHLLGHHHR